MQSVFSDQAWSVWKPLIEEVRPKGKTPPRNLRRTISAIFWRHQNGAKWRAIPDEFGPWCITHTCSFDGRNSVCGSTSLRRSKTGIRDILSALS
ncbi:transposase [Komagataeibacter oboediens]